MACSMRALRCSEVIPLSLSAMNAASSVAFRVASPSVTWNDSESGSGSAVGSVSACSRAIRNATDMAFAVPLSPDVTNTLRDSDCEGKTIMPKLAKTGATALTTASMPRKLKFCCVFLSAFATKPMASFAATNFVMMLVASVIVASRVDDGVHVVADGCEGHEHGVESVARPLNREEPPEDERLALLVEHHDAVRQAGTTLADSEDQPGHPLTHIHIRVRE